MTLLLLLVVIVLIDTVIGYSKYSINSKLYNNQCHQNNNHYHHILKAVASSSPSSSPSSSSSSILSSTYKIPSSSSSQSSINTSPTITTTNNIPNNNNINRNNNIIINNNNDDITSSSSSLTISEDELSVGPNGIPPPRPNPFKSIYVIISLFIQVSLRYTEIFLLKTRNYVVSAIISVLHAVTGNMLRSKEDKKGNDIVKNFIIFAFQYRFIIFPLVLSVLLITFSSVMNLLSPKASTLEVSFASFLKLLSMAPNRIGNLRVTSNSFMYLVDGKKALTRIVHLEPNILDKLMTAGIDFAAPPSPTNYLGLIWTFAYAAFLWNISTRMMQGPQDEGAGKRKDQGDLGKYGKLSFEDVAGQEKAKLEVKEVCDILKAPEKYLAVGARLPAGVLLVGPPGTGKTLLARVTAAEAGVPFYSCSASDFVEIFVGRGPARVRKLFEQAANNAPCIVFIDELDSIGRSRRLGSMNSEQENTLNQLLTCMDGLDTSNNGVIVMGATNRFELLDPALLRAGRFDRIVQCPLPDKTGRLAILNVHTKKLNLSRDVDLDRVARLTPGTCGADLCAIVNEAAIRTVRRSASLVNSEDFEDALKSFFSTRGVQLSALAEAAGFQIPEWLKKIAGQQSEKEGNQPAPSAQ